MSAEWNMSQELYEIIQGMFFLVLYLVIIKFLFRGQCDKNYAVTLRQEAGKKNF